jgi:glycosyltransferase involved in cell wall biosynthesis
MNKNLSDIEFIVGIPSYLESDSISFVTQQIDTGIQQYFGSMRSLIVNVDNHSEDDTKTAFLSTETKTPKKYITTREGVRGKGNNLLNLLKFAHKHQNTLKAALVIDADLKSITPEWVKNLADPILKGYDYCLPLYSRHQFDGTITNHICFPLIYGLLSKNIRQPIGGEFGFSPPLIEYWLSKKWNPMVRNYGIDIFMTLNAIFGDFKICQTGLGAKIHKASAPKLGPMFTQVVTTLFDILLSHEKSWLEIPAEKPKPMKRFGLQELYPPQELKIDILDLKMRLREEYIPRKGLLKKYLNDYAMMTLENMFDQDYYALHILMWTQVVYQLLHSYQLGSSSFRREIIEAMKPLYFARSITFNYLTWRYNVKYAEEAILEQAKAFASQKSYLIGLYINGIWKDVKKKGNHDWNMF